LDDLNQAVEQGRVTRWQLASSLLFDALVNLNWRGLFSVIRAAVLGDISERHLAEALQYYTTAIELLKESPDALMRSPERMNNIRRFLSPGVRRSLRTVERVTRADCRQRASLVTLTCALAAERFRLSHGCWPASLDVLVPAYLTEVPVDPFDLQPLRYRKLANGVVIDGLGQSDGPEADAVSI